VRNRQFKDLPKSEAMQIQVLNQDSRDNLDVAKLFTYL